MKDSTARTALELAAGHLQAPVRFAGILPLGHALDTLNGRPPEDVAAVEVDGRFLVFELAKPKELP